MKYIIISQFAAATYNCGAYSAGAYNEGECVTSTGTDNGTSGGTSGGGDLANTGLDVILFALIGFLLLAVSVGYLVRNIIKNRKSLQS